MSSNGGEEALLVWVKSFPESGGVESLADLASGIVLAKICAKIDSEHFSAEWVERLTKTKRDNLHLCQLNAKKLVEKVIDYYTHCLQRKLFIFILNLLKNFILNFLKFSS